MVEWYQSLTVLECVYFWLGIVATVFLVIQIALMCFSVFGADVDFDDDIDVDTDSGVSIFTVKTITAFLAVGSWAGLLTGTLLDESLAWVSVIVAVATGLAAMLGVAFAIRGILKLQCNGAFDAEKLVGKTATVYVSIPPARSGRGKITLEAQGRFTEYDAVTDGQDRIPCDRVVEIFSVEGDCAVVKLPAEQPSDRDKGE
ncbi:MAG: NfeD family protein [Candidatus Coproplasma sp.]